MSEVASPVSVPRRRITLGYVFTRHRDGARHIKTYRTLSRRRVEEL